MKYPLGSWAVVRFFKHPMPPCKSIEFLCILQLQGHKRIYAVWFLSKSLWLVNIFWLKTPMRNDLQQHVSRQIQRGIRNEDSYFKLIEAATEKLL